VTFPQSISMTASRSVCAALPLDDMCLTAGVMQWSPPPRPNRPGSDSGGHDQRAMLARLKGPLTKFP